MTPPRTTPDPACPICFGRGRYDDDVDRWIECICIPENFDLTTIREAVSTEIENLDKSQTPGLRDDLNRRGGPLTTPPTFNLNAETITGSNKKQGFEMPAERKPVLDLKSSRPSDERHSRVHSNFREPQMNAFSPTGRKDEGVTEATENFKETEI
jgi:hypothetical protein